MPIDPFVLVKIAVVAWMVTVAVMDHWSGRIPNWMTAPVFLGVGLFRIYQGFTVSPTYFLLLVAWAGIFVLWMLHFIGGGDAKFLMGIYALFPNMEFTTVLALILLLTTVPLFIMEMRGRRAGEVRDSAYRRVVTGQVLPTESELHERGRRYAWTFALPGIIYTLIYW
ncbi:MAG: prepilin peptidase [Anaerolineae bacterium]